MANKVKMLEDKLSGDAADQQAGDSVGATPLPPAPYVPAATPYEQAAMPQSKPTKAGADDHETSFNDNRPTTSSSQRGARPKTPKNGDDGAERPDTRRTSMALPYVAE